MSRLNTIISIGKINYSGRREGGIMGSVLSIAVVTGNPKPASRTLGVATAVAGLLAEGLGGADREPLVVDLAEHAASLFDPDAAEVSELVRQVAASDVLVAASPTYKASYTGMLKAFFDRYGNNGLAGVTAVPVMTGAWAGHLLAAEVHLRPLLVELGASVPTRALYVTEPQLPELATVVTAWAEIALPQLRQALNQTA
jgi:FMN reductase